MHSLDLLTSLMSTIKPAHGALGADLKAMLAGVVTGTILTVLSVTMVVAAGMAAAGAASLGWGVAPFLSWISGLLNSA